MFKKHSRSNETLPTPPLGFTAHHTRKAISRSENQLNSIEFQPFLDAEGCDSTPPPAVLVEGKAEGKKTDGEATEPATKLHRGGSKRELGGSMRSNSQESETSRGGETVIPVGSSRESSQQSDSWMDESKTTTKSKTITSITSTATGIGDGEDDTQIVETTTSKVMVNDNDDNVIVIPSSPSTQNLSAESQGNAEDATAFQHLVDEALKGVHEDVKMLASYCANLKTLLPEGKLGQSTIDGINDCLDDLKSCL